MQQPDATLFTRLGGEAAITAVVQDFYDRLMGDDRLAPFFEGLSIDKLIEKQIAFLTMTFGGPHRYDGKDLFVAHARLVKQGLNDAHFDAVAAHLRRSLEAVNVSEPLIAEVLDVVEGTRSAVLGTEVQR